MNSRLILRASALWAWSVVMSAITIVLGGVPLKSLRREFGRSVYWLIGLATAAALFAAHFQIFAALYLSLIVLMGLFGEWEELGLSFMASAFFSLIITFLITCAGVAIWISRMGGQWRDIIIARMDEWIKPALSMSPSIQVNTYDILLQIPSIVVVLWMAAIYLSVILERRTPSEDESDLYRAKARQDRINGAFRPELDKINLPSPVIWVFILALLGAFGEFGLTNVQAVAVNLLNICLMLFFFQGLAVIYRFFAVFRIGFFWQVLLMVIIIGQLFLLVSLVGLVDHWVDFRTRLSKGREEMNKELQ